jgi:hypothetical protein
MHDDRLKVAVLSDVLGEFVQTGLRELSARIVRVFVQVLDGDDECLAGKDFEDRDVARVRE